MWKKIGAYFATFSWIFNYKINVTFKAPITAAADDIFLFFIISLRKKKDLACHVNLTDDSHEMPRPIYQHSNRNRISSAIILVEGPRGEGGRAGGGVGNVRAEWPPFSALPGILLAPFSQQKSIWLTQFFLIRMWKAPRTFPVNAYIFSLRDLSRLLVLLVFNELTAIFV